MRNNYKELQPHLSEDNLRLSRVGGERKINLWLVDAAETSLVSSLDLTAPSCVHHTGTSLTAHSAGNTVLGYSWLSHSCSPRWSEPSWAGKGGLRCSPSSICQRTICPRGPTVQRVGFFWCCTDQHLSWRLMVERGAGMSLELLPREVSYRESMTVAKINQKQVVTISGNRG